MSEQIEITYEVYQPCKDGIPIDGVAKHICVTLWTDGAWREVVFDKELAIEFCEKLGVLAATL